MPAPSDPINVPVIRADEEDDTDPFFVRVVKDAQERATRKPQPVPPKADKGPIIMKSGRVSRLWPPLRRHF